MNERTLQYADRLSQMIRHETVSEWGGTDKTKFLEFHKLLKKLFPNIFWVSSFTEHEGSILMRWPGKSSDHPVCFLTECNNVLCFPVN